MKKCFLALCFAVSVGCSSSSVAPASGSDAGSAPVVVAPAPAPDAPVPGVPPSVAFSSSVVDCSNATVTWGAGKERYCVIVQKFQEKFGVAPDGKIWYFNRLKAMQHLNALEAGGVPKLVKEFGCDPVGWGPQVKSATFGPFTGAQHEIGGNEYLSAAFLVDGLSAEDLGHFLLQGESKHNKIPCPGSVKP